MKSPFEPTPSGPFLRGIHDEAGAEWLESEGLEGYALFPVYLGTSPRDLGLDQYPNVKVLVNLRYSYATPHGAGTIAPPSELAAFERACVQTMQRNPSAAGFLYCNEMNNHREWPEGFEVTPGYYVDSYNRVWFGFPCLRPRS